ncbi:SAM domain-containing protein [Mycena chlorophos]|uniref:RNA-binding protein VTS1 n=1 Tax=Mycena chlorophos TaxID=658473 RepID=A0A8H6RW12_MYCCL|nr:SAM domain-containing protein [Mycena chlorophos]
MSLRPPSSPSPRPEPENGFGTQQQAKLTRQSLGPGSAVRGNPNNLTLAPGSPRLAGGGGTGTRPTSELLVGSGSAGLYNQTPEAEALDQWFENLQNYEATLEDMAAASLDVNFKEELSAIEQWFKVLSEAERTAALYSLLQHSTQVQIRFFITVLQQMARSDPMTALLSPAVGGSMQQQMEAKLASLKSPGLKSGLPASPTARNFNTPGNRQSLIETPNNYLSPDSASLGQSPDAASTLAQQRAKLKASNAAHRISAPITMSTAGSGNTWGAGGLGQVVETNRTPSPGPTTPNEDLVNTRPKSTGSPGLVGQVQVVQEATVPAHAGSESWASMVTTPAMQMFAKTEPKEKAPEWKAPGGSAPAPGVPRMGDPTIYRRGAAGAGGGGRSQQQDDMYDDNGNFVPRGGNPAVPMGRPGWNNTPSPANNNNRFGNSDDGRGGGGSNNGRGGNGNGAFGGMGGMNGGMNPFAGVNMNMLAMGISPETQLLAAQMAQAQIAAAGGVGAFGMPGMPGMGGIAGAPWLAGPPNMGMNAGRMGMGMGMGGGRPPNSARTPRSATSSSGGMGMGIATPKNEEDVDPALLNDIPAWLRSLRLHKYTPNFEGMRWQDMVVMDEEALEGKGVAALGARRKMLKTFEIVRKKMGIEGGPPAMAA